MESDFVTQQHLDSLVTQSDPSLTEILNSYKVSASKADAYLPLAGQSNASQTTTNNDIFLGAMLGQIQASIQSNNNSNSGLQLNINTDVIKWAIALLLIATLVWVIIHLSRNNESPTQRRLRKLEKSYRKLKKLKNPNRLPKSFESDDDLTLDDFEI